jgi:hypothetical protein
MGDESQQEYEDYLAQATYFQRFWWSLREFWWQIFNKGGN